MGRYYSGDIEGKFWFGVQSSDDASFFGGEEVDPNYINYYFSKDDLETIEKGLKICKLELGDNLKKLDKFLNGKKTYTNVKVAEALGVDEKQLHKILEWYARFELGKKILACVEDQGDCTFDAEL